MKHAGWRQSFSKWWSFRYDGTSWSKVVIFEKMAMEKYLDNFMECFSAGYRAGLRAGRKERKGKRALGDKNRE